MEKEKTAIYCRVDDGGSKGANEQAIQIQQFKLEQYIKSNGLQPFDFYEDRGYAGHDLGRPGLQKLLADYHAGKFKYVLVTSIDRLFRGLSHKTDIFPFHIKSLNEF